MNRVSTNQLLQHGPFLRALALALVRDPGHADDVVQEAYLAALRSAPSDSAALRPWLARVVSNLARKVRRSEGRRARREARVASADYVRPTADILATESLRRQVVESVLALREPYRTAVLLRYYDDLAPRDIATRLGVSGSTVRSRLQRGLQELRGTLDSAHGDRRAWCLAMLPWAVPARAAAATPVLLTGAYVVKSKILWGALVLLVAGLGYLLWDDGAPTAPRSRSVANQKPEPDVERPAALPEPDERKPSLAPPKAAPNIPMSVVVRLEGGGEVPVAVTASVDSGSVTADLVTDRPAVVEVEALFADRAPAAIEVRAKADGYVSKKRGLTVRSVDGKPEVPSFEVTLRRARVVEGVARGPDGTSEGIGVVGFLMRNGTPDETAVATASVDADGRYALEFEREGDYLVVMHQKHARPSMQTVAVRGLRTQAQAVALAAGESVRGRITGVDGRGHAGTEVRARRRAEGLALAIPGSSTALLWTPAGIEYLVMETAADDEGRYEITGLANGSYRIEVGALPNAHFGMFHGSDGARYQRTVSVPAVGVDFEVPVAMLEVLVVEGGRPVADAHVFMTEHRGSSTYASGSKTDENGRVELYVGAESKYSLEVVAKGWEKKAEEFKTVSAGQRQQVTVALEAVKPKASVAVRLHAPGIDSSPVACLFQLTPIDGGDSQYLQARASSDGYLLSGVNPGSYRLRYLPGDAHAGNYLMQVEKRVDLVSGVRTKVVLRPPIGGHFTLQIADPDGRVPDKGDLEFSTASGKRIRVSVSQRRGGASSRTSDKIPGLAGPVHSAEPIAPGRYRLRVIPESEALVERVVTFEVKAGKDVTVEVALERR